MKAISLFSTLRQIAWLFWFGSISGLANAQTPVDAKASAAALMQQMSGVWDVQAKMWPAPNAKAVELPPAVARRAFVRDAYLQETMEPKENSEGSAFTRVAYLGYNPTNHQYEYFSLDSRLPQMMSYNHPGANKAHDGKIDLTGASFVAPEWGADKNVPFMYRFVIGPIQGDRQVAQLFLTRQGAAGGEFLAFEYVYQRRH